MKPTEDLLARIAERLKALGDPTRLKILHALETDELSVSDILDLVGGSQANVSKHLAILRRLGIVSPRREGLHVYYRVTDSTAFAICRTACTALERQAALEQRVLERAAAAGGRGR